MARNASESWKHQFLYLETFVSEISEEFFVLCPRTIQAIKEHTDYAVIGRLVQEMPNLGVYKSKNRRGTTRLFMITFLRLPRKQQDHSDFELI